MQRLLFRSFHKEIHYGKGKTKKNISKCQDVIGPSNTYYQMRKALLGEQSGSMTSSLVGEVALRCFPK